MSKKDVKGLIRRMYESYLSEKEKVLGLQQYVLQERPAAVA